jgi:hypothetical protein
VENEKSRTRRPSLVSKRVSLVAQTKRRRRIRQVSNYGITYLAIPLALVSFHFAMYWLTRVSMYSHWQSGIDNAASEKVDLCGAYGAHKWHRPFAFHCHLTPLVAKLIGKEPAE